MTEPFDVLGISPVASLEQARAAFKRLAMLYHPDRCAGSAESVRAEAEDKMRELNAAFAELVARRRGGPEPEEILASERWLADWWDARERTRLANEVRKARYKKWDEIEEKRRARAEAEADSIATVWRSVYGDKKETEKLGAPGQLQAADPAPGSLAARLAETRKNTNGRDVQSGTLRPKKVVAVPTRSKKIRAVLAES